MWRKTTKVFLCYLFLSSSWFLVAKPLTVQACSCAQPPSIEDQLNRKTAIFSGKVLSLKEPDAGEIQSSADPVQVQFEVKSVWKGELGSHTTVSTAMSSASCGYEGFEVNREYIVFAHGDPERLETGLCEGTKTLASAQVELQALGAGYEPTKTAMPQEIPSEISSINKETDNRFFIIVMVLAGSLSLLFLLFISLRKRRR